MKTIGYIRVSGESQVKKGGGLSIQRKALLDFARREKLELVGIAEDAGISGELADRPGLAEVEAAIAAGQVKAVLIHRLDRLARDLLVQERLLADWTARGVCLFSVCEPDLGAEASPERKFVRQLLGAVAELDKERLKARLRWGRQGKARKGGYAGGQVALGYKLEDGRLVVDPEEAEVVKRIARLARQGKTSYAIAKTLNAEGAPTKRGGRWYPVTISKLLRSATARGRVSFDGEETRGEQAALVSRLAASAAVRSRFSAATRP